jgi:tyrosyl-tRNA synthetase
VISDFHGAEAARKAAENFQRVFRERQLPSEIEEMKWDNFVSPATKSLPIARLISLFKLAPSRTEAERLIKQGAVEWDGKRITDPSFQISMSDLAEKKVLKVGKLRVVRVVW